MSIEVTLVGDDHLVIKLDKITAWAERDIRDTVAEACQYVVDHLPPDPAPSGRSMLPFIKSEKQLRWLMWAINSGAITVPYPRTGETRNSFKQEVKSLGAEFIGTVGSSRTSAIWTLDEKRQAAYHKGTWWTLQAEFRKMKQGITKVFEAALKRVVNGS